MGTSHKGQTSVSHNIAATTSGIGPAPGTVSASDQFDFGTAPCGRRKPGSDALPYCRFVHTYLYEKHNSAKRVFVHDQPHGEDPANVGP